jgi:scyllo-inositol 2-dehydrogenase (NADP+)
LSEFGPLRVLFHRSASPKFDYAVATKPLIRSLGSYPWIDLDVAPVRSELKPDGHQVVLAASDVPLSDVEAGALKAHLHAGGGLVLLAETAAAWSHNPAFADLARWQPGQLSPPSELRLTPAPGAALSQRLDPEILIKDRLPVGAAAADDAEVLFTVPWHYGQHVVGFKRAVGRGRLVAFSLGSLAATYAEPAYQRLVYRCLRTAAGVDSGPTIGVGLYGFGAIGREHAASVTEVDGFELRGICDRVPARLADASSRFDVATHLRAADMLADRSVDLVVVGVPPALHATAAIECLEARKHVVCEKPFALRTSDADRVMAAAEAGGRTVTVYQSRRWDPDFIAMRDAVVAGAIGDPFYLEAFIGGYGHPCSYWHSHEPISGGTVFDWGAHYFDWMLQLLPGQVVSVGASAHKRVWLDVTNADQIRVDVAFEGGEQATFMQSDVAAALKPKWYLLGTSGAIVGDWRLETTKTRAWTGALVEERLQPAEAPAVVRLHRPAVMGDSSVTELGQPSRVPNGFYRNLADHLLLGEPLAVEAAEARRNVAVMEAAVRSVADGGRPVEVRA